MRLLVACDRIIIFRGNSGCKTGELLKCYTLRKNLHQKKIDTIFLHELVNAKIAYRRQEPVPIFAKRDDSVGAFWMRNVEEPLFSLFLRTGSCSGTPDQGRLLRLLPLREAQPLEAGFYELATHGQFPDHSASVVFDHEKRYSLVYSDDPVRDPVSVEVVGI